MLGTIRSDMGSIWLATAAGMLAGVCLTDVAQAQITIDGSTYRIGISSDGNQHDKDDIGAAPMALAMIAEAGLQDRLVHHDYGNHLGSNNSTMEQKMVDSVTGAAARWGYTQNVFFNDQDSAQLSAGVANLAAQINLSTADNPFFIAAGGPMETVWRGINASDPAKRPYATVISHHPWNDKHADTPELNHTWDDIKASGVSTIHISDQNIKLSTSRNQWNWLKNASDPDWQWLHSRDQFSNKFDVSDAGMVWYILTGRGDQGGTPSKVQDLFNGNYTTTGGEPPPPPAGLVLHEPFDYTADDITGQNGGTGFSAAWANDSGNNDWRVQPGLEFDGIESTGKAADGTLNNRYEGSRTFDAGGLGADGSELWFSFLYNVTSGSTKTGSVSFLDGKDGWGVRFDGTNFAAMANGSFGDLIDSGSRDEAHLVVGRIAFSDSEDDTVTIWRDNANPLEADENSTVAVDFSDSLTGEVYLNSFVKTFDVQVDELRLGETLADVTPIPEPASLALLALGGIAMLARRSRQHNEGGIIRGMILQSYFRQECSR